MSEECPQHAIPATLGIIAGRGAYPWLLARSARAQGVPRVVALAFKGETDPVIKRFTDEVRWVHVGQLGAATEALQALGVRQAVMAGQIKPTRLFSLRLDRRSFEVLARLKEKNAHTIFGAVCDELRAAGVELLPAYLFMEKEMPAAGQLSARAPTPGEWQDIRLGFHAAKACSGLDIGQTVVLKDGTILAVEAFEGTDDTIRRAGKLGGRGIVVVKVAKQGHDMRFDIPIIGERTMKMLRKAGAAALALEAGKTIVLEREKVAALADRMNLSLVAVAPGQSQEPAT